MPSLEISVIDIVLVIALIVITVLLCERKNIHGAIRKHVTKVLPTLAGVSFILFIPFFFLYLAPSFLGGTSPLLGGVGMWIVFITLLFQKDKISKMGNWPFTRKKYGACEEQTHKTSAQLDDTNSIPQKTIRCANHFGYLSQRSKDEDIPDECFTCGKLLQCRNV